MKKLPVIVAAAALTTVGLGAVPAQAATALEAPSNVTASGYVSDVEIDFTDTNQDTDSTSVSGYDFTFTNTSDSTDKATYHVDIDQAQVDGDQVTDYLDYSGLGIDATPGATYSVQVVADAADTTVNSNSAASTAATFSVELPYVQTPNDLGITGTWAVGSTITATAIPWIGDTTDGPGSWTPGATVTYTWYLDPHDTYNSSTGDYTYFTGTVLASTTSPSLVLPPAAAGHVIGVRAVGHKTGFQDDSLVNEYWTLHTVANGALQMSTPKVTGKAAVGKKLSVNTGAWTPGTTFSYQWLADGAPIKHAHKSTLKLTKKQKGDKISVVVTGHAPAGYTSTADTGTVVTSTATKKVK